MSLSSEINGFCKLCCAKCCMYDLEVVGDIQVKHCLEEILCGFVDLKKTQRLLGTSSKEKFCLKINFLIVLHLSCLSNRGRRREKEKTFILLSGVGFSNF